MKAYGIGRITSDLELRKTPAGKSACSFTLACDKPNKKQLESEGKPSADFIRMVAWGKTAELLCQYCGKGTQLFVDGDIVAGSYVDNNGKTQFTTEVNVREVKFLSQGKNNKPTDEAVPLELINNDDLPF